MNKLIELLERNPFLTNKEIAVLMQKTEKEINKEVEKLKKQKIILGYKPVINKLRPQNTKVTAIIEVKITPEREGGFDKVAKRIYNFPEVVSSHLVSGNYDILLFVEGKTLQEVAYFVSNKLASLDRVQGTQTHFMLKTYKENHILMEETETPERLKITP